MFFSNQHQLAVARNGLDSQLALNASLLEKTFENIGKFVDLNLNAAKASLEESNARITQFAAAKDPKELFTLASAQAQPTTDKALAYARHVVNIASAAQVDFTKAAQAHIAEMSHTVTELVDDASKNAPAGSENIIAMMKSTIINTNAGFEQFSKTTQQTIDAMEEQLAMDDDQSLEISEKPVRRARK
ncbi:MAG: phasin family protein [Burkholderiales bacterium]